MDVRDWNVVQQINLIYRYRLRKWKTMGTFGYQLNLLKPLPYLFLVGILCFFHTMGFGQKSAFDRSGECWTMTGDGTGPTYKATGGNPGGYIEVVDLNLHQSWYWNAPVSFLGNKTRSIGKTLRFDIRTTHPGSSRLVRNVIIEGAGFSIGAAMPNLPGTSWTHNEIPMVAANWHYTSSDAVVSSTDFYYTLLDVTAIRILGEYSGEVDRGGLDNFELEPYSTFQVTPRACKPLCFSFAQQAMNNATSYSWLFSGSLTPTSALPNVLEICFPAPGQYPVRLVACNSCGCDTIIQTITVKGTPQSRITQAICAGNGYQLPGGTPVFESGTYTDTVQTPAGCDSLVTTVLLVKTPQIQEVSRQLCFGETLMVGDTSYGTNGVFTRHLQTPEGCDSTIILTLSVRPQLTGKRSFTVCLGQTVPDGDTVYATPGTFTRRLRSAQTGCDSLHTTEVTVINLNLTTVPDTTVPPNSIVALKAFSDAENLRYQWTGDVEPACASCAETEVMVPHSTSFLVTVRDTLLQCVATRRVAVKVLCPIEVPNLVTLNFDRVNDAFYLKNQPCIRRLVEVEIFNRWGDLMYRKSELSNEYSPIVWQPTKPGTYFYHLTADVFENEYQSFTGWVQVITEE